MENLYIIDIEPNNPSVGSSPAHRTMFSRHLYQLDTIAPASCDNQNCLQILANVRGCKGEVTWVENHWFRESPKYFNEMAKSSLVFLKKNKGNFIIGKHNVGILRILLVKLLLCINELLKRMTKLKLKISWNSYYSSKFEVYSLLISFNDSLEHKIFLLNKNQFKII